jgi:hypothetical protein
VSAQARPLIDEASARPPHRTGRLAWLWRVLPILLLATIGQACVPANDAACNVDPDNPHISSEVPGTVNVHFYVTCRNAQPSSHTLRMRIERSLPGQGTWETIEGPVTRSFPQQTKVQWRTNLATPCPGAPYDYRGWVRHNYVFNGTTFHGLDVVSREVMVNC